MVNRQAFAATRAALRGAFALGAAVFTSVFACPRLAAACAVCGSSQSEENQTAYLVTTGFLTFLPLIGVGLIVLWIRKRVRELDALPLTAEESTGLVLAVGRGSAVGSAAAGEVQGDAPMSRD